MQKNVLGTPLQVCSARPATGYDRGGRCLQHSADDGRHLVCAVLTDAFLRFTKGRGNDLSGLSEGDRWCLCAARWKEAERAGVAPEIVPEATNEAFLRWQQER